MKKGLVLEGGAMRGIFTGGILDVLMENGIEVDGAVGVSAGAVFGLNIKSQQIGRTIRYNKKYCKDWRYHSVRSLITTGNFFNVSFCYDVLPYELDKWDLETFEKNPMVFYCVVTDLKTGRPVYHKCIDGGKKDITWIQASASLPMVARPVHIGDGVYLDGGMSDSIPLKFMEHKGYDRILVIETQPIDYKKRKFQFMPIVRLMLGKYPNMVECLRNRHIMYNRQKRYVREKEEKGEILVIRPQAPLNINPVEKDEKEIDRVYALGREAGEAKLEEIKRFFDV